MPIDKNFREEVRFVVALIQGSQSRRMGVNKATKTHDPLWVGQSHTMINRQIAFVQQSLFSNNRCNHPIQVGGGEGRARWEAEPPIKELLRDRLALYHAVEGAVGKDRL